jgi:hypothetical protein
VKPSTPLAEVIEDFVFMAAAGMVENYVKKI